jgi:hypothetical protein
MLQGAMRGWLRKTFEHLKQKKSVIFKEDRVHQVAFEKMVHVVNPGCTGSRLSFSILP